MAMEVWQFVFFQILQSQITLVCLQLINAERQNEIINTRLIRAVVEQRFEEEIRRVESYLHPSTLAPLMKNLERVLIHEQLEAIYTQAKALLHDENYSVGRVPNAIVQLKKIFEDNFRPKGIESMERISDPELHVELILDIHKEFFKVAQIFFHNNEYCIVSVKKAWGNFINNNPITEAANNARKSAHFSTRACSTGLQYNTTRPSIPPQLALVIPAVSLLCIRCGEAHVSNDQKCKIVQQYRATLTRNLLANVITAAHQNIETEPPDNEYQQIPSTTTAGASYANVVKLMPYNTNSNEIISRKLDAILTKVEEESNATRQSLIDFEQEIRDRYDEVKQQVEVLEQNVITIEKKFEDLSERTCNLIKNICTALLGPQASQGKKWKSYWQEQIKALDDVQLSLSKSDQ
ncbi:unnamed protein product [Rotaria sp. Silwood1]|nr:unnamed protein product [Rotaria sp. Silwood1]